MTRLLKVCSTVPRPGLKPACSSASSFLASASSRLSRTATWHASNGQVHNQVDVIPTLQNFKSSINKANVISFPCTNISSDHDLVPTTIYLKLKTKCFMKSPHIRFHLEKLADLKIVQVFQTKMVGRFAALCVLDSDVDTRLKEVLFSKDEEVIGRQRRKIQPLVTIEVLDLCDQGRQQKQQKHTSTEAKLEYTQVNREVRKKMKAAKEEWIEEQC